MTKKMACVVVLLALGCSKKARDDGRVTDPHGHGGDAATAAPTGIEPKDNKPLAGCQGERPAGSGNASAGGGDCKSDADCTQGKNGRCHFSPGGGPRMPWNSCSYDGCFVDTDCGAGLICYCNREAGNACQPGNCRVDSDCGGGGHCEISPSVECFRGNDGSFCRTAQDACKTNDDCKGAGNSERGAACVIIPETGAWGCKQYPVCPVG